MLLARRSSVLPAPLVVLVLQARKAQPDIPARKAVRKWLGWSVQPAKPAELARKVRSARLASAALSVLRTKAAWQFR